MINDTRQSNERNLLKRASSIDTVIARVRREEIELNYRFILIQKQTQDEYPVKNSSIVTAFGCLNGL
jgi:hypothetical protein